MQAAKQSLFLLLTSVNRTHWHSYISHKAVAIAAGVGWQGKSLVVVNREHGPRIRLATILTNLRLEPDEPITNLCGACSSCAEACPGQAINKLTPHYTTLIGMKLFFLIAVPLKLRENSRKSRN